MSKISLNWDCQWLLWKRMNNIGRRNLKMDWNIPNKRTKIKLKDNYKQTIVTGCKSNNVTRNVSETIPKNHKNSVEDNVKREKDETNNKHKKCSILKIKINFKLLKCESLLQNWVNKRLIFKTLISKWLNSKLHLPKYQEFFRTFQNIITLQLQTYWHNW